MTQMIYRPQTGETMTKQRQQVHKVNFRGLPCDALVIEEAESGAYAKAGWFLDPNEMIDFKKDAGPGKRRGRKPTKEKAETDDGSVHDSQ